MARPRGLSSLYDSLSGSNDSPGIVELEEGEGRPLLVLQVQEDDLAVLVEQVLDVLVPDVRRQIADVDLGIFPGHVSSVEKVSGYRKKSVKTVKFFG